MTEIINDNDYWVILASVGEVDDVEYNEIGTFYGISESGKPMFEEICDVSGRTEVRYSSLAAAEAECKKIASLLQLELEFNEEVFIMPMHYEDEELVKEADGQDVQISYHFKDLTGSIVVWWRWVTHVGYCRDFLELKELTGYEDCHDESLLVKKDHVYRPQCSLLFTAEEVASMEKEGTLIQNIRNIQRSLEVE